MTKEQFRKKWEGANVGESISSLAIDEMLRDIDHITDKKAKIKSLLMNTHPKDLTEVINNL